MGSPVTLSGFNNIDFSVVLKAIMQQERLPVTVLETQKKAFEAQKTAFGALASKLAALESAAQDLARSDAFGGASATVSDPTVLTASAGANAPKGSYEIVVNQLARAQVTTTTSTHADADTTVVADGGTLTLGGVNIVITGDVTLQSLADTINAAVDAPATATIVRNGTNYQLVLTGKETGNGNAFAIDNKLTLGKGGGKGKASGVTFASTNTAEARDAAITINGVTANSATNTFDGVIGSSSFTVLRQTGGNPVTVIIAADSGPVRARVEAFVSAYNELSEFVTEQTRASGTGNTSAIGRDPLVRSLRNALTSVLNGQYDVSGQYTSIAQVGLEFDRVGKLSFKTAAFDSALANGKLDVAQLFGGDGTTAGVFAQFATAIEQYTAAGGLVPNAQSRLDGQLQQISKRVGDLEARLEIRRAALQEEFIAADLAIAQLNSQLGQLGNLGGQFRLF